MTVRRTLPQRQRSMVGAWCFLDHYGPGALPPPVLHGVQFWTALPAAALATAPTFEHHGDLPVLQAPGAVVRVILGQLPAQPHLGVADALRSSATIFTPLVGAQIDVAAGAGLTLALDPTFEHAVLVDTPDPVAVDGARQPGPTVISPARP